MTKADIVNEITKNTGIEQKVIFSLKDKIKNKLVKLIVSRVCSLFKYQTGSSM